MDDKRVYIALDVGERRIGVAQGDSVGRIAQPAETIRVEHDAATRAALRRILTETEVTDVVIGRPRNQAGDTTAQTRRVEQFVAHVIEPLHLPVHWQDESVTSVVAEARLRARKKAYSKSDIDAEAASVILQDFLDRL